MSDDSSTDPRAVLRGLALSVYVPSLLEFSAEAAVLPVVPLLALDLGFTVPQAAALTTILGAAAFVGPIPAGMLIDRVGARRSLVATGALLVLTGVGAVLTLGPVLDGNNATSAPPLPRAALIGVLVMMAVCSQVWQLGRQSYLGSALPPAMRARGMTLYGGTVRIGQVVGPLLGAGVIAAGHDVWVFALQAVLTSAATVMVAVFLPPGEAVGGAGPRRRIPRRERSATRARLTRAVLVRMVLVAIGIGPLMMSRTVRPVVVPLLGAGLGLDAFWISLTFGLGAVIEIVMVVPAGTLMDRRGRAAVAVPCCVIVGLGYLLLVVLAMTIGTHGWTGALAALVAATLVIAFGNGLGSGIVMTLGIDVSPVHGRTRYLGWWNTLIGSGRFAAPLLIAGITAVAPVTVAIGVTGGACLAGAVWLRRVLPGLRAAGGT